MKNSGNLPMKGSREIDRAAVARLYGFSEEEIDDCAWRLKAMYVRQPESTITLEQYLDMMRYAGLRPSQIGKEMGKYQFARYGDRGVYSAENARFIPAIENQRERDMGYMKNEKTREKLRESALTRERRKCGACKRLFSPGMFSRWHGDRCRFSIQ